MDNVALLTESVDWNVDNRYYSWCCFESLSSRRAWIEIVRVKKYVSHILRRSPHGERGLKFVAISVTPFETLSLSSRRAWIEIIINDLSHTTNLASLSSRRAWIEIYCDVMRRPEPELSLSSRRAWIEIQCYRCRQSLYCVALLTESVDWNKTLTAASSFLNGSLSSRRAWIEILISQDLE